MSVCIYYSSKGEVLQKGIDFTVEIEQEEQDKED